MALTEHPVFVVMVAAAAAPLLAELPTRLRVPVVVLEVLLGVAVGPHGLGWLEPSRFMSTMSQVGMATLLFMAGMEIDFSRIRGRPLLLGLGGWGLSLAIGLLVVAVLHVLPWVDAPMMVTLALATTGLGVLLPVLRDGGQLDSAYGRLLLAAGTVGELGPIVLVSLLLSQRYGTAQEMGLLLVFLLLMAGAAAVGMGMRPPRVLALLSRTLHASTQLPVRLVLVIVAAAGVISETMGFERILGAFAAGMIVGLTIRGEGGEPLRVKLDAVCFGLLVPFFFVGTGMMFDLPALLHDLRSMLLPPALMLVMLGVRGLPVLLYRNELGLSERLPFALSSSVSSLGLVVVIAEIGVRTQSMSPEVSRALVAAALLSTLVFPTAASLAAPRVPGPSRSS
ncbi:MAG: cation:proton antiporter [Rubrivivax sp.]|nr:cation:proton antiporter [Rubrivivax sp.]HRY88840.1 cation:proton antiporter [Rubrivivax sp.]